MVKSYSVCHTGLSNKRELAAETQHLAEVTQYAHRQSSEGHDLIRIVFKEFFLVELVASRFFFSYRLTRSASKAMSTLNVLSKS